MAENSKIEWTDHTFNPWTGCTKVSPGCDGCYAEAWAKRSGTVRWGADYPRRLTTDANWRMPLKWNRQAETEGRRFRVFCASLADVFDNAVPPEWRADLFQLIADTPYLDWLLLTKRIGNAEAMLPYYWAAISNHVWIGATVVNQAEADRDIPKLLGVPARVRFLSIEPMLGPITINPLLISPIEGTSQHGQRFIDWIICGGESGPRARPMHPDWARSLRDQCAAAGVPFLHKQWGEWLPGSQARDVGQQMAQVGACDRGWRWDDGTHSWRIGKKAAGRLLDGVEHNGFPAA